MGTRPGRILEVIHPNFERQSDNRDAMLDIEEYRTLEKAIRQMMRAQSLACA
ncbi:MAG: hypothetical protein IPG64_21370 [Haliea sp.]|nr:hypothetical protein [Haliea sp.]MBK6740191.1 hypothetical protein [Haliea sp.]